MASQRALINIVNARLRENGWNPRKHYVEFAFGILSGKQYTSNNVPIDLDWDGRSGFGRDFPLFDGDRLNLTIGWKECMYDSDEMNRVSQGNNWMNELTICIMGGE